MDIIPAIDLIDGCCVRLLRGDFRQQRHYATSPLEMAQRFQDAGLKRLHLVDLDGARKGRPVNIEILAAISKETNLLIDYSGGLRCITSVEAAFAAGASQVLLGSAAVRSPELLYQTLEKYGSEKVILGADVKERQIMISGWQEPTCQNIIDFLGPFVKRDIQWVMCTDISSDGMLEGPSFTLYSEILQSFADLKLIASGGVSSYDDLIKLAALGLSGVVVGKAIYEGKINLSELQSLL